MLVYFFCDFVYKKCISILQLIENGEYYERANIKLLLTIKNLDSRREKSSNTPNHDIKTALHDAFVLKQRDVV